MPILSVALGISVGLQRRRFHGFCMASSASSCAASCSCGGGGGSGLRGSENQLRAVLDPRWWGRESGLEESSSEA